jgi:hypothetical protein
MDTGFDAATLWRLRVAASLATALPVRVLVTDGPRLLFEVRRPPLPEHPARTLVPPCWFRAAVAGTWVTGSGPPSPLLDVMRDAADLGVSTVLDHPGAALAGGVWRLDHPGSAIHVFATGLAPCGARAAIGTGPEVRALEPGYLCDPATGVTLVSATAGGDRDPDATLDVVHGMLARCVAAELVAEVGAGTPPGGPGRP